jgi:hypothetical protein
MKNALLLFFLLILSITMQASTAYRAYLMTKIYKPLHQLNDTNIAEQKNNAADLAIPRYKIPAGNVFCIMEDKLTKATKVWITVGVK